MAVSLGLLPCLAAWAWQLVQNAMAASEQASTDATIPLLDVIARLTGMK